MLHVLLCIFISVHDLCCSVVVTEMCGSDVIVFSFFFFSSRRRHTRFDCDWSSDVCSSDLLSLGLAPMIVDDLAEHLLRLNHERGMAVLLVEQNARLALELCPRAYVLEAGRSEERRVGEEGRSRGAPYH